MKRFLSILLAAIICVSTFIPIFAVEDADVVKKLILEMKTKFGISDEEFVFVNYSKDEYGGKVTYNLNWEDRIQTDYTRKPYISICVEEDGDVIYYRKGYTSYQTPSIPKFTEEEALAKAKEYIDLIAPDKAIRVDGGKLVDNSQYIVEFERIENGIPVYGNGISIDLNPEDLSLISFNVQWADVEFPSLTGALDRDEAIKAYIDNLGYEIVYNIYTERNEIKRIYTSFVPKAPHAYIDPFTGEAVTRAEVFFRGANGIMADKVEGESSAAPQLSPEELQLIEEIKSMITKEEAEKIARSIPEFNIREDATIDNFRISKNRFNQYIAHLVLRAEIEDGYYSVYISINAMTKEVISFGKSQNYDTNAPKYDADKANKKAQEFIEKYYSEYYDKTKPDFIVGERDKYSLTFDRYENGIRVDGNVIAVHVHEYTGEIDSVNFVWADVEFPPVDVKVLEEDLYKNLLTDDNFRLQYNAVTDYTYNSETGKQTSETKVYPIYAVLDSPIFSTEELRELDYKGNLVAKPFEKYTDTEGHYCHDAATILGKMEIFFEGENLNPDKAVTQEEFLNLMFITVYGYKSDNFYNLFINDGVIEKDEIKDTVTRMEAIKFLLNAEGYKKVSEISGIFNCPFTDVEDNMKGYAAIAGGLGIVNANTDTLRADALLTRAECIMILYNYLNR